MEQISKTQPPLGGRPLVFPRGQEHPVQSPLFWVEQKDRYLRQLLIRDIEEETGRRLVVYFANKYEAGSDIQAADIANLTEVLFEPGLTEVDIFLETGGGSTDATESLISTIKSIVSDLQVIVPNAAKSNGTLLALAARCIIMGATSELGPIEPSIQGIPCSILDTPEIAGQNFPLHMLGKFALQQSRSVATQLLSSGMMAEKTQEEIESAVDALASRNKFPSHGSVVDHREATSLGLKIEYMPPESSIWQKYWLLYCMYDYDSRKNRLLKIFESRSRSLAIAAVPVGAVSPAR